jgi:hypothetical protein
MLPSTKKLNAINLSILNRLEKQYRVGSYIERQEFVSERMRSIMVDWLVRDSIGFRRSHSFNLSDEMLT